jgi:hypothetical protein
MLTRLEQFLAGGNSSQQSLRSRFPPPNNHPPMAQVDPLHINIGRQLGMFRLRVIRLYTLRPDREHLELLHSREMLDGCQRLHHPLSCSRRNLSSSRFYIGNSALVYPLEPANEAKRQKSDRVIHEPGILCWSLRHNQNHNRGTDIYRSRLLMYASLPPKLKFKLTPHRRNSRPNPLVLDRTNSHNPNRHNPHITPIIQTTFPPASSKLLPPKRRPKVSFKLQLLTLRPLNIPK